MSDTTRRFRLAVPAAALLAAWIGAAACTSREEPAADTAAAAAESPAAAPAAPAAPAAAPALTDPQIAHVAVTANAIDSAAGAVARTKAQNQEVKDFARQMVTDHGGVNRQAVALATRLGVTPEDNDVSRSLTQGAEESRRQLEGVSGAAFDRAYIAREVAYHQAVLDALDQTLIPGAQNAELKKLLQDVRPAIDAHLQHAKRLQGTLGGAQ
jgi:putative membrane protein